MTPEQYRLMVKQQRSVIAKAERAIATAHKAASKEAPPPKAELRAATATDIKPDAIIWHDNGDEGWFWNIVDEPLHYGDAHKAYVADDGCRYGLDGAWVRKRVSRDDV